MFPFLAVSITFLATMKGEYSEYPFGGGDVLRGNIGSPV